MDRLLKGKDFSKDLKNNSVYPHTLRAAQDAKTAEYYEEVIIPQKIKEAEKKLIEEIQTWVEANSIYQVEFGHYDDLSINWIPLKTKRINIMEVFGG